MALDSTVKVKFLGDAANLAREAARASRATDEVGKSAERAHSHLSRMAKSLLTGAGIAAAAVGIEKLATSTVNAYKTMADETVKLSRVTGQSAQDASHLIFAAKETGVEFDVLSRLTGRLEKNLAGADKTQTVLTKTHHLAVEQVARLVKGHLVYVAQLKTVTDTQKHTVAATQSLGFALRDAAGHLLPMSVLLPKIADHFQAMRNGPEKTALALKLFGKEGAAILPLLNQGSAGLAKFSEEADKLGITMSGKDVAAYSSYLASQRAFHAAIEGAKISLGRELFPVFAEWTKALADNGPALATYARELGDKIAPAAQSVGREIATLAKGFHDGTGSGGELKQTLGDIGQAAKQLAGLLHITLTVVQDFEYGLLAVSHAVLDVVGVIASIHDKIFGTHWSDTINRAISKVKELQAGIEATRAGATIPINVVITTTHVANPATHAKGFIGPTIAEGLAASGVAGPYTPFQTGATAVAKQVAQAATDAAAATKAAADKTAAANKAALDKELATAAAAQKAADVKAAAADALQKATDKLRDALQSRLDTAKGIRDSIVSSNGIVRDGVSWTAKDLLARFTVTMGKVKRFQAALSTLVARGFDPTIVSQVAAAGVQGGLGTAIGLAHATSAQERSINAAQRAIAKASGMAGESVASQMGQIQTTTIIKLNDAVLARAVNTWNAQHGGNGHRLAG